MKLRYIFFCFTMIFLFCSCTNLQSMGIISQPKQTIKMDTSQSISIVIPNNKEIKADYYKNLELKEYVWNKEYYNGNIAKQQILRIHNKTNNTIEIERRVDNGWAGSGIIYTLNYSIKADIDSTIIELKPLQYTTYTEGVILPFGIPTFKESDLYEYIKNHTVRYTTEINSQYNTESIFANFKRLAKEEPFTKGQKDILTGTILSNMFYITYKEQKVYFYIETFPYRNGTKAVINVDVPGCFTSENIINFNVIIKDINSQIESIVNA